MLGLLDIIAPIRCVNCGSGNTPLCPQCASNIDFLWFLQRGPDVLNSLTCMARFSGALIPYVHEMKFGPNQPCAEYAGELLFLHTNWVDADCVTCAPLSKWRLWERGFNQAELMADRFAKLSGIPFLPLLIKQRFTSPQAEVTTRKDRLTRLIGTLAVNPLLSFIPKKVLLIDDVCTTGATLSECATVLKTAGATEIHALTLAREL